MRPGRRRLRFGSLAMFAGLTVLPATAAAQTSAANDLAVRLLAAHNRERARVGVPLLRWDPALAVAAASWGRSLSTIGRLQHSPRAGRPGQSENLWMGTRAYFSPEQMVGSWTMERADFRPGIFPNVSRTGNWFDVSHYTQMIWRSTTRLGCAAYRDRRYDFLVCRYAPRGNIDGRRVP
jgi:hypothetical protein